MTRGCSVCSPFGSPALRSEPSPFWLMRRQSPAPLRFASRGMTGLATIHLHSPCHPHPGPKHPEVGAFFPLSRGLRTPQLPKEHATVGSGRTDVLASSFDSFLTSAFLQNAFRSYGGDRRVDAPAAEYGNGLKRFRNRIWRRCVSRPRTPCASPGRRRCRDGSSSPRDRNSSNRRPSSPSPGACCRRP